MVERRSILAALAGAVVAAVLLLAAYPAAAYTRSHVTLGSAICEVAILFATFVAAVRLGYTSK